MLQLHRKQIKVLFKGDNASQWKSQKFDPSSRKKPFNRSSPK